MIDLREILEFRFNKHLMSYNTRKEICEGLEKQNLKTYGDCLNFEFMSETNYIQLDRKIAIICKIPIKKEVDEFKLTKLFTLPIKIKNTFYQAKNVPKYIALGKHFRTILDFDFCHKQNNIFFCSSSSEYRALNESETCIGNVLAKSDSVYDRCEFDIVKSMQDQFINIEGKYYYSVNKSIVLEIFCMETLNNAQVTLSGIGSLIIKKDCYAKMKSLLLTGSNTYTLEGSFEVSRFNNSNLDINFALFNFSKIDNFQINIFNNSLNTNLNEIMNNNSDLHNHVITLYAGMSFFLIPVIALIFLTKFIYSHNKQPSTPKTENDIPKPALVLAKASRNKKISE